MYDSFILYDIILCSAYKSQVDTDQADMEMLENLPEGLDVGFIFTLKWGDLSAVSRFRDRQVCILYQNSCLPQLKSIEVIYFWD